MSAGADWTTNGGATSNQRYSTLDEIDTSNVSQLKGVWRTHLNGVAMAAKYSGESQPLVQDGVIYVTAGNDDVFAVSVDSGKILWQYKANLDQKISTVCCGWLNRGVALGDGRVYLGQLDGKVRALDQKTGAVLWTRQLVQWQKGQTITGAPLFLDGKIYLGVVGADFGTRGFLEAIDAETGDSVWRSFMIPAPGEPGSETGPRTARSSSAAAPPSGRHPRTTRISTCSTSRPAMPAATGTAATARVTTSTRRRSSRSIATRARSSGTSRRCTTTSGTTTRPRAGPVRRREQRRHGEGDRRAREDGLAVPPHRATGKPLYGIDEKPVPQNEEQKTAKTQPFPRNGEFIPHTPPTAKEIARVKSQITGAAKNLPVVVAKEMFTPPSTKHTLIYTPGPQGGNNWEPTSYNPDTHMFYVCAADQTVGRAGRPGVRRGRASPASADRRYRLQRVAGHPHRDRRDRRQRRLAEDLVRRVLQRHRHHEGQPRLRRAQQRRPAGVRRPERKPALELPDRRRRERHGCRSSSRTGSSTSPSCPRATRLMASPHGDSLWLFSLDGTMGPASQAPGTPATGTEHAGHRAVAVAVASRRQADAAAGKTVFSDNCAGCHGVERHGRERRAGPDHDPVGQGRPAAVDEAGRRTAAAGCRPSRGPLTPAADQGRHCVRNHQEITNK